MDPTRWPSYEGGGLLDLVWAAAGKEMSINNDPKSIQRIMRVTGARRGDHYTAELILMHGGKREMSCFFAPFSSNAKLRTENI